MGFGPRRGVSCTAEAGCWAVQKAAWAVVAAKVRGHYGGPAQTFEALERGLQARLARSGIPTTAGAPGSPGVGSLSHLMRGCLARRGGLRDCCTAQQDVACVLSFQTLLNIDRDVVHTDMVSTWWLLDFMVALERNIQAACHGSCALPPAPFGTQAFFLSARNQKVLSSVVPSYIKPY